MEPIHYTYKTQAYVYLTNRSIEVLGRIPLQFTTRVRLRNLPGSGRHPSRRPQEARRGEAEYLVLVQSSVAAESEHRVTVFPLLCHVALLGPSVLAATWRPSVKNPRFFRLLAVSSALHGAQVVLKIHVIK